MKKFGIKVSLPNGDTMSAAHLLGDEWESTRWFADEKLRDEALAEMKQQPPYYRKGDTPTVVYEKIESENT
ncbi:hypothetical protein AB833_29730 [Chromatiales bacterium (ex Bugula neritina AB1)]|nr:hypothetical protein AB833_29730 [Chromatiales bacterium (ex Bugula neritina AB1)]